MFRFVALGCDESISFNDWDTRAPVTSSEEVDLDALEVLLKAREEGGEERKDAMEYMIRQSRTLGCASLISDSKEGGFKIRYGSIRYAIMDVNTKGRVYLHIKAHPNKELPEPKHDQANEFIAGLEGVVIKNGPINCYGQVEEPIENIPRESIDQFLNFAVDTIQTVYYNKQA